MTISDIDKLKEDFNLTVKELGDTYEELSLLYRISEELSGLGVDEICKLLLREVSCLLRVETVAILLFEDQLDELHTKTHEGNWSPERVIRRGNSIFWDSLDQNKAVTICNTDNSGRKGIPPEFKSILVAPLIGKKRRIGIILLADRADGEEFFAGDIKLIRTLSSQAALFIENALLSREAQSFLIGTIRSFVKALEASSKWTAGHTERVTTYALAIAKRLGFSPDELERLRVSSLLHDIGKIATPDKILNKGGKLTAEEWFEIRQHPVIGAEILSEMGGFIDVIECIRYHHESFDGKGLHRLKGIEIPLKARILAVADAFDAMTSDRPYRKKMTVVEALKEIEECSGTQFDPAVVKAFSECLDSSDNVVSPEPELHP